MDRDALKAMLLTVAALLGVGALAALIVAFVLFIEI
jgi:hypothetical protein